MFKLMMAAGLGCLLFMGIEQNSYAADSNIEPSSLSSQPARSSTAATTEADSSADDQAANVSLMFAISAKSALLEKLGKRGYYTLTIYDVNPYLTYFSERPERDSGVAPVQNFIKAWDVGDNSFQSVNPNALLVASSIDGVPNQNGTFYLMTCSVPEYHIDKSTLTFVVKPLPKFRFIFDSMKFGGLVLMMDHMPKNTLQHI